MSQHVPPGPYVYQPDPAPPHPIDAAKCRIWSVGGVGTEMYTGVGQRYTKAEAERIVESVKNRIAGNWVYFPEYREVMAPEGPVCEVYDTAEGLEGSDAQADVRGRLIASSPDLLAERDQLRARIEELEGEAVKLREFLRCFQNYRRCTDATGLSPYIRENGLYGLTSPWAEACDAADAAALLKEKR